MITSAPCYRYQHAKFAAVPDQFVSTLTVRLVEVSSLHQPLDEATLAHEFGYSRPHFRRLCHSAIGESAVSFVRRVRLERAAMCLASERSVASVARDAGFQSREAFAKAFYSHFGCTPAELKRLNCGDSLRFPTSISAIWDQVSVRVQTADFSFTTFLYDGVILLGRTFSDGRIDWRSDFRRDARRR
ncbi:MAG: helix-turn-helix transcriptional regulator [Methanoregulaceae archaeon]|nr:helix-turn-helix transcriptional regulator [Methanoregulaceae archaeon]